MNKKPSTNSSQPYDEWMSLYSKQIGLIWQEERPELKKVSMIYFALQKELLDLRNDLSGQIESLRSDLKTKDLLQKACNINKSPPNFNKKTSTSDKENYKKTPGILPLQEVNLNDGTTQSILEPDTSSFDDPAFVQSQQLRSPTLGRSRFSLKTPSPSFSLLRNNRVNNLTKKSPKRSANLVRENKSIIDDSVIDCSIIENSPQPALKRTFFTNKKRKVGKVAQTTTLTQMFDYHPPDKKEKSKLDLNIGSMLDVDEILSLVNRGEEDNSNSQSDATVDDLEELADEETLKDNKSEEKPQPPEPNRKFDKKLSPKKQPELYDNLARGKARQNLKGFACKDCEVLYSRLPPAERQRKIDECSRHKAPPREETFSKFWDLTFGPTPPTPERRRPPVQQNQESPESLVFNYRR